MNMEAIKSVRFWVIGAFYLLLTYGMLYLMVKEHLDLLQIEGGQRLMLAGVPIGVAAGFFFNHMLKMIGGKE